MRLAICIMLSILIWSGHGANVARQLTAKINSALVSARG